MLIRHDVVAAGARAATAMLLAGWVTTSSCWTGPGCQATPSPCARPHRSSCAPALRPAGSGAGGRRAASRPARNPRRSLCVAVAVCAVGSRRALGINGPRPAGRPALVRMCADSWVWDVDRYPPWATFPQVPVAEAKPSAHRPSADEAVTAQRRARTACTSTPSVVLCRRRRPSQAWRLRLADRSSPGSTSSPPVAGGGSSWPMSVSVSHWWCRSGCQPRSPTSSR